MTSDAPGALPSPLPLYRDTLQLGENLLRLVEDGDWDSVVTLQERRDRLAARSMELISTLDPVERAEAMRLLQAINVQLLREGHAIRLAMQQNRAEALQASRTSGAIQGYGVASMPDASADDNEAYGLDLQQ
jgi:hypothetical protein